MSVTFTATVDHIHQTTSRASVRTHTALIDRGVAKGGLDLGPAGGEYLLVALGGCFTSHLAAAIHAREVAISGVQVAVTGTLDGTPQRFVAFTMAVSAEAVDDALARKLIIIAARACQVVSTLIQVAPITITFKDAVVGLNEMPTDSPNALAGEVRPVSKPLVGA